MNKTQVKNVVYIAETSKKKKKIIDREREKKNRLFHQISNVRARNQQKEQKKRNPVKQKIRLFIFWKTQKLHD